MWEAGLCARRLHWLWYRGGWRGPSALLRSHFGLTLSGRWGGARLDEHSDDGFVAVFDCKVDSHIGVGACIQQRTAAVGTQPRGNEAKENNGDSPASSRHLPQRNHSGNGARRIIFRNSARVRGSERKSPNRQLVIIATPGLWMPRVVMQ